MEGIVLVDGRLDEIARLAFNRSRQRGHRTITIVKLVSGEIYSRLIQLRSVVSPRERKRFRASDRSSRLLVEVPAANLMFFGTGARLRNHPRFCPHLPALPSSKSRQSPRVKMFHSNTLHLSTVYCEFYRLAAQLAQLAKV